MLRPSAGLALALGALALAAAGDDENLAPVDFQRDVAPLLSDKCFACHGPDESAREADLRLDLEPGLFGDRGGYVVVAPGDLQSSELWLRVSAESDGERMPPPDSGRELSSAERALLARWIEQGAPHARHWAFEPPRRRAPPSVRDALWPRDELDRFVLFELEARGLAPSPEASRETLLRRLSLDLIGLPPTLAEQDAFQADTAPDAYERALERLLASPHYGERMALAWLDVARYADSNGYHRDKARTMWLWRDWLIEAFAANKPYDAFVVEQLAGDQLEAPTLDQLVATGFNRNHMLNDEGGAIPEEYQVEYVVDRVRTSATAFLGLTMACAQCHDHKYDPIRQEEYYRFYAFFDKLPEKGLDGGNGPAEPRLAVPSAEERERIAEAQRELELVRAEMSAPDDELDAEEARWAERAAAERAARFALLTPTRLEASGGARLELAGDGSVRALGANPALVDYELEAQSDAPAIGGLLLEALFDEALDDSRGGLLGRSANGNFVVSELEVEARALADPQRRVSVAFAGAVADHSQAGYPVRAAIDGDAQTGWAVEGHRRHERRSALFVFAEPVGFEGGTLLSIRLRQRFGGEHALARFRLSVATESLALAEPCALGEWSALGPIAGEPGELFQRDAGPEGGASGLDWRSAPELVDGEPLRLAGENSAYYFRRTLDAPSARTLSLSLGSDDALAVWWNGERVLASDVRRGVAADQERLDVAARAGTNDLLVEVVNHGGRGGVYFRLAGEGPALLPGDVSAALRASPDERGAADAAALRAHFRRAHVARWPALTTRVAALEARVRELRAGAPALMVMRDEPGVRMTTILARGRYDKRGRTVTAGTPAFLPPLVPRGTGEPDRLDLARWMVDPRHPLTARVAVNRIWQTLFGTGLVRTPEDFGSQGEPPANPALLDYLACELVASGWDVKALVRRIARSATYRQSSRVSAALLELDPGNLYFARAPKHRLQAELVRDAALSASGLLCATVGGPSVRPYQPAGLWEEVTFNDNGQKDSDFYTLDEGDALWRRSLYTFWKRSLPPPAMQTFDAPSREVCVVRRDRTNTPLQALVLLNDPTFLEAARALAQRTLLGPELDDAARLSSAFRRVTSRRPADDEVALLAEYLELERARFAADGDAARALLSIGASPRDERLAAAEHAAWTAVCSLILNLDEAITRS